METAAQLAETDLQEFRLLNPSFNRPVVVAAHQGSILIPAAKADAFVSNLINWQATGKPLSNWSTHTVKKGETLKTIAKRYGMTEDEVRAANKIPKNRRVQVGSTILVKDAHASQDIQVAEADSAMRLVPLPTTRRITYRVRSEIPYRALPRALVLRLRTFANKTDSKATQSRWAKDCA